MIMNFINPTKGKMSIYLFDFCLGKCYNTIDFVL